MNPSRDVREEAVQAEGPVGGGGGGGLAILEAAARWPVKGPGEAAR